MSETLKKLSDEEISEIKEKLKDLGFFIVSLQQDLSGLLEALRNNIDTEMDTLKSRENTSSVTRMKIWTLGQFKFTTTDSFKKSLLDLGINIQDLKKEFEVLKNSIQQFTEA